ncbi:MAG: hypothetical protein ACK5NN_00295 [Sphingomonadaceae bacterium]
MSALISAVRWLAGRPALSILGLLILHVSMHQFVIDPRLSGQRDAARAELRAEQARHEAVVASYRQVAIAAQMQAERKAARAEAEQRRISEEVTHDYETRLADLRSRAARPERLHAPGRAATDSGGSGGVDMSQISHAASGADETAGEDGFSCPAMSASDRLIASEQALQLDALIAWVRQQAGVSEDLAKQ